DCQDRVLRGLAAVSHRPPSWSAGQKAGRVERANIRARPTRLGVRPFERSGGVEFAIPKGENEMSLGTILLIILILILIGALPTWPYSSGWGYYPSSGLGIVVIILLILVLLGRV